MTFPIRLNIKAKTIWSASLALVVASITPTVAQASTIEVGNFSELDAAVTNATDGDLIEFTNNIISTKRLSTSRDITIDGKDYLWSVPTPGLNEAGLPNSSPSTFGLITFNSGSESTIKNVSMWGGYEGSRKGVVLVNLGATVTISESSVERGYTPSNNGTGGGGGVVNFGTTTLDKVNIRRNAAAYGGGFLNRGGVMIIKNSTFADNRSTSTSGGGGAGENTGDLWIINSTFANNFSTEIGSAINNYRGNLYVAHSTFVGNLGNNSYRCGAIGVNGGEAKVVSSLFAYNYEVVSSSYKLVDIANTSDSSLICGNASVDIAYSLVHSSTESWRNSKDNGVVGYAASIDGQTDETIFSGGARVVPTIGTGQLETSLSNAKIFRPSLILRNGLPVAVLKENNTTPDLASAAPVYFSENGASTILAYWDRATEAWVTLKGTLPGTVTTASDANLTSDQIGEAYNDPAAIGATEFESPQTFQVVAVKSDGGEVSGASVFGDAYVANTPVEVAAIPDSGKKFSKWEIEIESGSTLVSPSSFWGPMQARTFSTTVESTNNPVTFQVNTNTTITPVFSTQDANTFAITYSGNQATSGSAPTQSNEAENSSYTVLGNTGNLQRTGYSFNGWNTSQNGGGTSYGAGDNITVTANVTLYAQWTQVSTVTVTYNGNSNTGGTVPSTATVASGASYSLSSNSGNLVRTNFSFGGWNTQADGEGTNYSVSDSITPSVNTTLFAKWNQVDSGSSGDSGSDPVFRPYTGPLPFFNGIEFIGCAKTEMRITGSNLYDLDYVTVGGNRVEFEIISERLIDIRFGCLAPGEHVLMFHSRFGNNAAKGTIVVVEEPLTVQSIGKVNAGSFKGYVAVYALNHQGARLSAKVGQDWIIVDPIPNNASNLFRVTDFTGPNVDISVRIYIDRKLVETIPLTTK